MNDTPCRGKTIPDPPDNPADLLCLRYIGRYWMKFTTPSEFMLLMFIADRTLGWCKDKEVITRRQMKTGVAGEDTAYHLGTTLGASTIDKVLKSLVRKQMISGRAIMRGTTRFIEYTINM